MADRFDRFSEYGRYALTLAQEEAELHRHDHIGSEHLLIALTRLPEDSGAVRALVQINVVLEKLRELVESIIGRGDRAVVGEISLTPRSKKVIEYAVDECRRLNGGNIGSEHLLLGLTREGGGIAAGVLKSLGATLERTRLAVADSGNDPLSPTLAIASARNAPLPASRGRDRFGKFTERARRVLTHAQEEAARLSHRYIGPEHLLLGLIREGDSVAGRVLAEMNVQLDATRAAVEQIAGRDETPVRGEVGLTSASKRVFEDTIVQTRRLNHGYIGTEHLLLGVLQSTDDHVVRLRAALNIDADATRERVLRALVNTLPQHDIARTLPLQDVTGRVPIPQLSMAVAMIEREAQLAQHNGQTERATQLARIADELRAILEDDRQRGGG
jgi:ATP-dependent Clp protease ATP-binding subunit ClpA